MFLLHQSSLLPPLPPPPTQNPIMFNRLTHHTRTPVLTTLTNITTPTLQGLLSSPSPSSSSSIITRSSLNSITRSQPLITVSTPTTELQIQESDNKNMDVQLNGPRRPIYLDALATTAVDPRVLDFMMPLFTERYGNAHSRTHFYGWEAADEVEWAREQVASVIGASPKEIIFTSGATESNNIAIKGIAQFYQSRKKHIITATTEHKCVLDSCRYLSEKGFDITYLPVQKNGLVDLEALEAAIRPDTGLVSVMGVNNEIGVIQPLKEIGELCRKNKVFFHTDCAQAVGKIPLDVDEMKIDAMSISGHKIYGPKGVGALYVVITSSYHIINSIQHSHKHQTHFHSSHNQGKHT
eukprot:TRINITY_DN1472_c0_g2_i1.p1 TRINITY_DN1472_c0_g2~~TRINITY_DN1472_c0_g2_i1.p1  ORF type:complete len:352 (-),score=77.21 TRINITY_DN1472_c0_g2_i1:17-1072(-)